MVQMLQLGQHDAVSVLVIAIVLEKRAVFAIGIKRIWSIRLQLLYPVLHSKVFVWVIARVTVLFGINSTSKVIEIAQVARAITCL